MYIHASIALNNLIILLFNYYWSCVFNWDALVSCWFVSVFFAITFLTATHQCDVHWTEFFCGCKTLVDSWTTGQNHRLPDEPLLSLLTLIFVSSEVAIRSFEEWILAKKIIQFRNIYYFLNYNLQLKSYMLHSFSKNIASYFMLQIFPGGKTTLN